MRAILTTTTILAGLCLWLLAPPGPLAAEFPRVEMQTNLGSFVIELYPDAAPKTVANFLQYLNDGFYDNTLFHRLVKDLLLQGGGYTHGMVPKRTRPPVENEASHGIGNSHYSVAMARDADPNSGTSQFFVNLADNHALDFDSPTPGGWGYTVFGRVVKGTEVIDAMAAIPVLAGGDFMGDRPAREIVLERARLLAPAGR
jgi:cyclophilin family peptidyl-prolyl cis-trans isomerase